LSTPKPKRARSLMRKYAPAGPLVRQGEHLEIATDPRRFGSILTQKNIVAGLDRRLHFSLSCSRHAGVWVVAERALDFFRLLLELKQHGTVFAGQDVGDGALGR
jgi:hypothetical protein